MAEKITRLIANPSLRATFGAAGPKIISKKGMNVAAMVRHHLELYRPQAG
jgi:hypothetical protein